jgi:hypothetical protein
MMGGWAFDLLKTGRIGLESAKQLKICLAGFPKILLNLCGGKTALFMGWCLTAPYR